MIRRHLYGALAVAILIASASMTTYAQLGELRGQVWMQQADGQKVPLADAQIDVFRVDMVAKYNSRTNKNGEFIFAGLPFIGTYTVAASHPTAKPNWVTGVKAGRDILCEITLTPGDGKRLTLEEIKAAGGGVPNPKAASGGPGNGSSSGGESASDRAIREALAKKNAEIEANNKKITEANEIIARTFKAGNEALSAANVASKSRASDDAIQKFTAAVTQYDEGLAADSNQPAILTNKAVALKGRGVERFNAAVSNKTLDDAGKSAALQNAKDDWKAAAEAAGKAVMLIKAQVVPTDPAELQILATTPDSPEANLGAGLAAYAAGDKTKFQEAANYLQHFVDVVPDSNPMKDDAKAVLTELKTEENITPQKSQPAPRRRP